MAPVMKRTSREACHDMQLASSSSVTPFQPKLRPAPRITAGMRNALPLSLTANQFRLHTYAIATDDEVERYETVTSNMPSAARQDWPGKVFKQSDAEDPSKNTAGVTQTSTGCAKRNITKVSDVGTVDAHKGSKRMESKTAPPARTVKSKSATRTRSRSKIQRRILQELQLFTSLPDQADATAVQNNGRDIEMPDAIVDGSTSEHRNQASSGSFNELPKVTLTALKSHLESRQPGLKILRRHRYDEAGEAICGVMRLADQRGCDGFDASELTVRKRNYRGRKRRSMKEHSLSQPRALQLRDGPLPNVRFEPSPSEPKLEIHHDTEDNSVENPQHLEAERSQSGSTNCRIGFNIHHQENLIRSQLASISAPPRIPSESSEDEGDSEDDDEDDTASQDDIALSRFHNDENVRSHSKVKGGQSMNVITGMINQPHEEDHGVTLDFRSPMAPGQLPRQPLGKRSLVEVNEAILEVSELEYLPANYMLDTSLDALRADERHMMQPLMTMQQPRSILRNGTPVGVDSRTRPEHTQMNTRRNSVVEPSESTYFANASNTLYTRGSGQRVIIPRRRSSMVHFVKSKYLITTET